MLKHLQANGHRPIVLLGGATGMIGDPSGKSQERNLLDEEALRNNQEALKKQLSRFLDFDSKKPNSAIMVNNYDWMKDFSFLQFIRDVGKHITVNYMMSKDSVKKRLGEESRVGMSFTEFTYQLVQGYDFFFLYKNYGCKLQWAAATSGETLLPAQNLSVESLAERPMRSPAPSSPRADGGKFGKTEQGNIWLDSRYTTPYRFYQFWLMFRTTTQLNTSKYLP